MAQQLLLWPDLVPSKESCTLFRRREYSLWRPKQRTPWEAHRPPSKSPFKVGFRSFVHYFIIIFYCYYNNNCYYPDIWYWWSVAFVFRWSGWFACDDLTCGWGQQASRLSGSSSLPLHCVSFCLQQHPLSLALWDRGQWQLLIATVITTYYLGDNYY